MSASSRAISILGCGWYGLELAKKLAAQHYSVKGSTTTPEKLNILQKSGIIPYLINLQEDTEVFDAEFFNCETLIISIPPKRSTGEQHTFLAKIERIASAASQYKVPHVIFISSTSVYGECNGEVDENTPAAPDTASGQVMLAAELLLKKNPGFGTTVIRFGGLIGPERNPGKFFAGKTAIPNGKAPVNLIHLTDCIGITVSIIEKAAPGLLYNACSAEHPSRAEFYTAAALKTGLAQPHFIDELKSWKQINSINIKEKLNYTFEISLHHLVSQ